MIHFENILLRIPEYYKTVEKKAKEDLKQNSRVITPEHCVQVLFLDKYISLFQGGVDESKLSLAENEMGVVKKSYHGGKIKTLSQDEIEKGNER